jgi:hypothetical protein
MNGVNDPWKDAKQQADGFVNGVNNAWKFPIYQSDNFNVNAGIDMFGWGVSVDATYTTSGGMTLGASVGYGFMSGWYASGSFYQQIGNANVGINIGGGNNHWGWNASMSYYGYGIGYGKTYYGNAIGPDGIPNAQTTGTATIFGPYGSFRLENDFLGDRGDRWRTNAWELTIGDWSVGSSVYTNDGENASGGICGIDDTPSPIWGLNRPHHKGTPIGAWKNGQVYSSPLWIGHKSGNSITRIGYSNPYLQDLQQNGIHKWFRFGRQNYYLGYGNFRYGPYVYAGYFNFFSLF